jgi:hypothetical protein
MTRLSAPLAAILLASCAAAPEEEKPPLASATAPKPSERAALVSELKDKGIPENAGDPKAKAAPVEADKRFDYADVYVDQTDPTGQRKLVPYLLKTEEWQIDKVEYLTPTLRHYRFRRLLSTSGKPLPDVDPLQPKR